MAITLTGLKTCPRCGETKPALGNFYKAGSSADGFSGYCVTCMKEKAVAWQKANPERVRAIARNRAANMTPEQRRRRYESVRKCMAKNPEKYRALQLASKRRDPERQRVHNQISNNRKRAKQLGRENTFQFADWKAVLEAYANTCAFCGVSDVLLDLEHLDALKTGGHNVPGNVVPACRPCNAQKSHRTLEEFCKLRGLSETAIRGRAQIVSGLTV